MPVLIGDAGWGSRSDVVAHPIHVFRHAPPGCPLAVSDLALRFTGHGCSALPANSADTVYFMEGADGNLYSGWADGRQGQLQVECTMTPASF